VFADFINPSGEPFAAFYQERFQPSPRLAEPHTSVCVWAICAETDEEAMRLSMSARMMLLSLFRGRSIPVPPVEEAEEFLAREGVPAWTLPQGRRLLTGSPKNLRRAIETVASDYGAQEVFVVNIMYDHNARLKSYELLA
jgi:alkanesulfonate monooxygenase SsuD/methylene tetrahydromethanopterin reductase-like flavin-dependent oxidoreductase (luciferase family)